MKNELNLSIEGMHCGACVRRVTAALSSLDGIQVESVKVGSARVAFDQEATSPEKIVAAVNEIGFAAKVNH